MTPEKEVFEAELAALRDNVCTAFASGISGRAAEGLDVYRTLLRETLTYGRVLFGGTSTTDLKASGRRDPGTGSTEWHLVIRDLSDIAVSAGESANQRTRSQILEFLKNIAMEFIRDSEEGAFQSILAVMTDLWTSTLESGTRWTRLDQAALLLRLSNFADFAEAISFTVDSSTVTAWVNSNAARAFVSCIKAALDAEDEQAALLCMDYLTRTQRPYRTSSPSKDAFSIVRNEGMLALHAWIIYKYEKNMSDSLYERVREKILAHFASVDLWPTAREALRGEHRSRIGWHWWEVESQAGPNGGGLMTLSQYVLISAILLAPRALLIIPRNPNEDDVGIARMLHETSKAVINNSFSRIQGMFDLPTLHRLDGRAQEVISEYEDSQRRELAAAPLNETRVLEFIESVSDIMESQRGGRLLSHLELSEPPDDDAPTIGFNHLFAKWWFVDSYVHASPRQLAEDLVPALCRAEDQLILDVILAGEHRSTKSLDAAIASIKRWLSPRRSAQDYVLATNSWTAASALLPQQDLGKAQEDVRRVELGPVFFRVFDDRPPFISVFHRARAVCVSVQAPKPASDADTVLPEQNLLVYVGIPKLSDFGPQDDVDALNERMSQGVVVRLLERLWIAAAGESDKMVWDLPHELH